MSTTCSICGETAPSGPYSTAWACACWWAGKHGPISQPDGFAGTPASQQPQGITPASDGTYWSEPIQYPENTIDSGGPRRPKFVHTLVPNRLPRTATGYTPAHKPAELYTRPEIQHALDSMIRNFEGVVRFLQERIEYAELKNDAYRKVWSAREYIRGVAALVGGQPGKNGYLSYDNTDAAFAILSGALNEIDRSRVDGDAIRAKYKEIK